jgi:hypothetical protein
LLASKWSNDPTRPYDFYAAELGSTGALIRPTNIVRLMECWNGADCPTPVFNPAVAANPINGSWFVDTWYSRGAAWLVQGTPNGTPPPPPPGPSLGKVAPANGATGQPTSVTLSWGAVTGATDYQVCADTTNDGVCAGGAWTSVGLATTHVLSGLSAATTFYWQVQATVDSQTLTGNAGAWWSFVTLSIPVAAVTDFNGNGSPDLVWRNAATGQNAVWYMNGTTLAGEQALPPVTDTRWQIAVVADLDADGKADLVWRNTGTGDNAVWHMNGSTIVSNLMLPPVPDTLWQIVAAADFSGDGKPDLVWRHRVNGQNVVWYLNGTQVVQVQSLPSLGNPAWQIAGAADFDRDGSVDLLWRHGITGQNAIWLMNGVSFRADAPPLPTVPDPAWRVGQVVDLNSDGHADIVWRHSTLGHNGVWLMNGVTVGAQAQLPGAVPAWHSPGPPTVASSDFDGNGTSDILWRNTATGDNAIWRMDGTSLLLSTSLAPVANTAWQIVASGDFNGDTQPDVVWRNAVSGRVVVWLMQGTVLQEVVDVPPPADPQCEIAAAADMNGDGMVDLVWRNAFTGTNFVWLMGGTALLEERPLPSVGSAWRLVAAADFNWDGKPDLVWRKVTTGQNEIWFMNGTSWASAKVLPPAPNPAWQLVQAGDFNRDGHADLVWRNYLTGRNVVWLMRGATCISEVDLPPVPDPNWKVMRDRQ